MSIRPAPQTQAPEYVNAGQLRMQIETLRTATMMADQDVPLVGAAGDDHAVACAFDSLSETEKSAATIGASANELKPIGWMNTAHYTNLLKKNALSGRLTQQIEAYKSVTTQG